MNKRQFDSLVKRAAYASRMETGEYESIMDEAGSVLEQPKDGNDDVLWEKFCKAVEKACEVPLTAKEKKELKTRQQKEELERAKKDAENAQRYYESLLKKSKK